MRLGRTQDDPALFEILGAKNLLTSDIVPISMAFQQKMWCPVRCVNCCSFLNTFGRTIFQGISVFYCTIAQA